MVIKRNYWLEFIIVGLVSIPFFGLYGDDLSRDIICEDQCVFTEIETATAALSASMSAGGSIRSASWDQDSKYIAVGTNDNGAELKIFQFLPDPYVLTNSSLILSVEEDAGNTVSALAWHPNSFLAVGTDSQSGSEIQVWNHEVDSYGNSTLTLINTVDDGKNVNDLSWSCNGFLAVALNENTGMQPAFEIRVFQHNVNEYNVLSSTLVEKGTLDLSDDVASVSWSPASIYDGTYFLAAAVANHLHVYSFDEIACSLTLTASIEADNSNLNVVRWSPDGEGIAVGGGGILKLYMFDEFDNILKKVGDATVAQSVESMSWSSDGENFIIDQNVAVNFYQKILSNFDTQTGLQFINTIATGSQSRALDWAPDCRCIAQGTTSSDVDIWCLSGNEPPIAQDDVATTKVNVPVTIDVLANDSDPDMDILTIVSVTQPSNGVVVINGDSTVTYTPNVNFHGVDTFTYTISDGYGGSDTARVCVCVEASDIIVTKTVSRPTANEGEAIIFTVTVTNNGPNDANQIEIEDVLPSDVTFVSAVPSIGLYDDISGVWSIGSMIAGSTQTLTITVLVNAGTSGMTITNTARFGDSYNCDVYMANNSDSASFTVNKADLVITNVVDKSIVEEGDTVIFTVTATNNGPDLVNNVIVNNMLPSGVTLINANVTQGSYSVSFGEWSIGALAVGASATLTLTVTIDSGTTGSVLTNTASVQDAYVIDPYEESNSVSASVTVITNFVRVGSKLFWEVSSSGVNACSINIS